jgi:hypothetical protein
MIRLFRFRALEKGKWKFHAVLCFSDKQEGKIMQEAWSKYDEVQFTNRLKWARKG